MEIFKEILFPVDFSECSEAVFPCALDAARKFDAKLYLLFVVRDISYLTTISVQRAVLMNTMAEVTKAGERQMEEFCRKHMSDFPNYETRVIIGYPPEEILNFANEKGVDLIIMSTHGRKRRDDLLMGSVADYVIKNATVPVLTVNPFRFKAGRVS